MRRQPLSPLVIGAGPAGCAAAITLARAGHAPVLIDRHADPGDKVCGDFLGPDTIAQAETLGCRPTTLGAVPVTRVRLVHGRRETETALPFAALSLSRRRFDQALRESAMQAGATLRFGETVRRLSRDCAQWAVTVAAQPEDARGRPESRQPALPPATAVFLATGKHDLRDHPRPRNAGLAVGLKQYLRLSDQGSRMLGDATELTLFPGGYAGLQPVEAGRVALCLAVRHDAFQDHGGSWDRLLDGIGRVCPRFAALVQAATPLLPKPLAVAGVPYGFLHGAQDVDGLFRVGDQAAVIPSLTGDGLAIALHSGRLAAETWARGGSAAAYHKSLRRGLKRQMRLAGALHAAFLSPLCQPWVPRAAGLPWLVRQAALLTRVESR